MSSFARRTALLAGAVMVAPAARAQSPLWAGLERGPHAVGFRITDTEDVTRSFPRDGGGVAARAMRFYVWYPARSGTGTAMRVGDLVAEGSPFHSVLVPADMRAFGRVVVRARAGPAFDGMSDSAADALLGTLLVARRDAAPAAGPYPVVLLAPGQPLTMPVTAEYLASNGMVVIGVARKGAGSIESLEFTPNSESINAEADDLAFALGVARQKRNADATRVGVIGYSSSGLSNLAFAFRSRAPLAVAAFEGWEAWEGGQPIVRALPAYDPRGFRAAYLLLEKTAQEASPGLAKTSAFFDTMVYSPRWRIAFDDAAHTDFASLGVALPSGSPTVRRNFARAHEVLRDFMLAELGPGWRAHTWRAPPSSAWMHVTAYDARAAVPTNEEFFHLAETDPAAADTLALRLAALSPPIVPFTQSSLSRLALLAMSRRPSESARLYGIVARAFPSSASATAGLSDALAAAGKTSDAAAAAARAVSLLAADSSLSSAQRDAMRQRLSSRARP